MKAKTIMIFVLLLTTAATLMDWHYFPSIHFPHYKKIGTGNAIEFAEVRVLDENGQEVDLASLFSPQEVHHYQYIKKYLVDPSTQMRALAYINAKYNAKYGKQVKLVLSVKPLKIEF